MQYLARAKTIFNLLCMSLKRTLSVLEIVMIVGLAAVPLLATFPYRLNIFLSWEGAYRLYLGQTPYKDFGMPVGYMYWVIPAIFFKIFGPAMITLVKAQVFINILAGLSFRSILKSLDVQPGIRFTSVLLFCFSYSFFNYWPWYNHTVIVYELIALAFLMKYFFSPRQKFYNLIAAAVFICFSFFTKQDGGGLALLVCVALLAYEAFTEKRWRGTLIFAGSVLIVGTLMVLPFLNYNFGYWFNHGQAPHSSRISMGDLFSDFFNHSQWLKFYLIVIALLLIAKLKDGWKNFILNKRDAIFTLLTLGILVEAIIFQVTSYVPVDNNIFFHSFAIAFILSVASTFLPINFNSWKLVIVCGAGILLWWSDVYYKFFERFISKPKTYATYSYNGRQYANEVNRNTYMIAMDTTDIPVSQWRVPNLRSFKKVLLPNPTVDGIERLMQLDIIKQKKDIAVLNMTELTPLAAEIPFKLETGSHYPLWYHKGVSMFDKETRMFCDRINKKHYDLVLFEYIPFLNNFYPFEVRDCLQKNYRKIDSFVAPRKPSTHAWVEVYIK